MKQNAIGCLACLLALVGLGGGLARTSDTPDADPAHLVHRPVAKAADLTKPVQVFILMGQSNMFGMGDIEPENTRGTLAYFTHQEQKYRYLVDDGGNWTTCRNVRYVQVMPGKGPGNMQTLHDEWLTVKGKTFGPEIGFGYVMGQQLNAPVLILKSCIGNRSLGWDLLPPGSEQYTVDGKTYAGYKDSPPSWPAGQPKPAAAGWYAGKEYDDDVANAKRILGEIGKHYPGATRYEIAGFVWWQGHKDQTPVYASRYEQNLARLIPSLRKDFNAPKAPFVLATIAFGGWGLKEPGMSVASAQLAISDPAKHPEFAGNVKTIEARNFWRPSEESPNAKQDYHYYHNAGTYMDVGQALGWAMDDLLIKRSKN